MYTNAKPHIGFGFELVQADVLARYHRMMGDDVRFLTGTDEHGQKIDRTAKDAGKGTLAFVDEIAESVQHAARTLNISNDDFIRTTDSKRHWPAVEKIWRAMVAKGDLYKKSYEGLYCVGHEAFMKKSDLVDGMCPMHKTEPEKIQEENWFFKLTNYKKEVYRLIESGELRIVPETRKNEILNLVEDAEDISFSRPRSMLTWGIPVPDDDTQTIYVWADALTNYISALGYATDAKEYQKYWPANVHLIGKDILRFHALYWPAMLLSAELPLPKEIYVHGFITVDGEKMSKSLGNVIDPIVLVEKYGADVVRYFLMREIPSGEDGDFSYKKLEDRYNGDLANGLGNLVQRVATLIENNLGGELIYDEEILTSERKEAVDFWFTTIVGYEKHIQGFELHRAVESIWAIVAHANRFVDEQKPWAQAKENPKEFIKTMTTLVVVIHHIARMLQPFMPKTAEKIFEIFGVQEDDRKRKDILDKTHFRIKKGEPLFPRLT